MLDIKLIKNNVMVGSQIAVELAKLRSGRTRPKRSVSPKRSSRRQPVVIGASVLDCTAKVTASVIKVHVHLIPLIYWTDLICVF